MQDELSEKNNVSNKSVNGFDLGSGSFLDFRCTSHSNEKVRDGLAPSGSHDSEDSNTDFFKDPKNTASLIRWKEYNSIYPILGAYGGPSYIHPTKYCCVIGTARGPILIFSLKQILLSRLIPQLAAGSVENDYIRSEVNYIAVSVDGTHLAATYRSGDVFIWNLNASDTGASGALASNTAAEPLKALLHVTNHCGKTINGAGFVSTRHTALVVSDDSGQILYHNGFRSRLWSLKYSSKAVMRLPTGQLLCSQLAPFLGNKSKSQYIAILTTTKFGIISLDTNPDTLFTERLTINISEVPLMNHCLSWSKNGSQVAFSLNSSLYLFVFTLSHPFGLQRKSSFETSESIIALYWVSEELLGALTVSHQLLLFDITDNFKLVMDLDLLMHDLLIPPDKYVAMRDNEIYALTQYTLKLGKFATWLDVTLSRVQKGNYIGALNFFETLLKLHSPVAELIKLETHKEKKDEQLGRPFFNLALAALRFIFENSHVEYDDLYRLFSTVLRVIRAFQNKSMRSDFIESFLEQSLNYFSDNNIEVLYEVLVNYVAAGLLTALPPTVFKNMLEHYAKSKRTTVVEELIMALNPSMLDIDLAVRISKDYGLFNVLIYIWTGIFHDYLTPFVDAIYRISQIPERSTLFKNIPVDEMETIFVFLSFTLTGRQYPAGTPICSSKIETKAKTDIYEIIFSGSCVEWPPDSLRRLQTKINLSDEPAFPYLRLLLQYSPLRFLSTLNEAFEDSFLNNSESDISSEARKVPVSRQNIIYIMLDVVRRSDKNDSLVTALLAVFISSNASKYPQFIRLNKQDFENVIDILCEVEQPSLNTDIQRALESILTVYAPPNTSKLIKQLEERKFTRVLFSVYTKARRFTDLFLLAIESEDTTQEFGVEISSIAQFVLKETKNDSVAHSSVADIIQEKFTVLLTRLGAKKAASIFDNFDYQLHQCVETIENEDVQLEYLNQVFEMSSSQELNQEIKKLYIDLKIHHSNKTDLTSWLRKVDLKNMDTKYILSALKADRKYEEAFEVHHRLGMFSAVVEDMLFCINDWFKDHNRRYELLDKYLTAATDAANASREDMEANWTKLIACLFNIFGRNTIADEKEACNYALQRAFVKLAISDSSRREGELGKLEGILTSVLEHQDIIMKKVQDLGGLLIEIFTAYNIEQHISRLILKILENSSTGMVSHYKNHVKDGQSIHSHECIVCGKKIWGLGLDTKVFEVWETARRDSRHWIDSRGTAIVLFFCHHSFHKQCLENLGQREDAYFCLTCPSKSKNSK